MKLKLHPSYYRAGLFTVLATGPALALAAGESTTASAWSDNLMFLGAAAALIVFALTRKPERQAPPAAPASDPEPADEPAVDAEQPAAEIAAEAEQPAAEAPATVEAGTAEAPATAEATPPQGAG